MYIAKLYKLYNLQFRVTRKIKNLYFKQEKQVYLRHRISEYQSIWHKIAEKLSANIISIDSDIWIISKNGKKVPIRLHQMPLDNDVVLRICGRKEVVHKLLSKENIPVPKYCIFDVKHFELAKSFMQQHPKGVVVKPSNGYSGLGVTTHIYTEKQLQKAMILASLYGDSLIIEEQIAGENYRILVFRGKVLHAVKRTGVSVIGDGHSKISKLLDSNILDKDIKFTLNKQDLSLQSIPKKDELVLVRSIGTHFVGNEELRTIYDADVTNLLHSSIVNIACKSVMLVNAELVGVDIITTDITKPLDVTHGVINELNTTPALHHHYDITKQEYPLPALKIVEQLLNES